LKSPTATEIGPEPTLKVTAVAKLPVPDPSNIATLFDNWLVVTRSIVPSPLKSLFITEYGALLTEKLVAAAKLATHWTAVELEVSELVALETCLTRLKPPTATAKNRTIEIRLFVLTRFIISPSQTTSR
jgi:hypothetical protein